VLDANERIIRFCDNKFEMMGLDWSLAELELDLLQLLILVANRFGN
jgi:hypothetical protein